jgi:hypothetical protein
MVASGLNMKLARFWKEERLYCFPIWDVMRNGPRKPRKYNQRSVKLEKLNFVKK